MVKLEKKPKVLVLLSLYNGQKYIDEQIKSLIEQREVSVSVLIRDDGSTDDCIERIDFWKRKVNIELILGENCGAKKSFLELIKVCSDKYDYYAFCDQDDYWENEKLICAINKMGEGDKNTSTLYYSSVKKTDSKLNELRNPFKTLYYTESFSESAVFTEASGCTMVFNNELLRHLKLYIPNYCGMHDMWVLQVCSAIGGKVIYDFNSYILYRQHDRNVIGGISRMKYNKMEILIYRLRKMFDYSYSPYFTCCELKKGYYEYMDSNNKDLVDSIILSKTSMKARISIILSKRFKTRYFEYNIKFSIQTLLNKL